MTGRNPYVTGPPLPRHPCVKATAGETHIQHIERGEGPEFLCDGYGDRVEAARLHYDGLLEGPSKAVIVIETEFPEDGPNPFDQMMPILRDAFANHRLDVQVYAAIREDADRVLHVFKDLP